MSVKMESFSVLDIDYEKVLEEIEEFIQKISNERGVDVISVSHSITIRANPYTRSLNISFLKGYYGSCIILYQK
ncbi:hypothetical protein K9M50_02135 [Patescibacteria group bacterium]|nr:hypothetical protein [Patescibacteria group bacterium]